MTFLKHSFAILLFMGFIIPHDGLGNVAGRYQCYLSSGLEDHSESFDLVIRHEPIEEKIQFRTHIFHTNVGSSIQDSFFQDRGDSHRTQSSVFGFLSQTAQGKVNTCLRFNTKKKLLIYSTLNGIWNCYQKNWNAIDGDPLLPAEPIFSHQNADDISSDSLTEIDVFSSGQDADSTSSDSSTSNSSIEIEVEPQIVRNGSDQYFRCPNCRFWDYTVAPVKRHMKNCF
jgi:hypothetical protein